MRWIALRSVALLSFLMTGVSSEAHAQGAQPCSTGDLQGFRGRGVGDGEVMPTAFALRQNRPNPFSGTTEIRFELPAATPVRLEVFDAQGRVVRTLAQGSFPVGFHSVVWDQRDASGAHVRPGIYFYRIVAGAFRAQRKMMLL